MSKIRVQFVRGKAFSSKLIGYGGRKFSHVDIMLPDGRLLGARSDVVGEAPREGVYIRPQDYEKWELRMLVEVPCTPEQQAAFYNAALSQLGKEYDKWAILGFIFGRNWREDDKWICSELLMFCAETAKLVPSLWIAANQINPAMAAISMVSISSKATVF